MPLKPSPDSALVPRDDAEIMMGFCQSTAFKAFTYREVALGSG